MQLIAPRGSLLHGHTMSTLPDERTPVVQALPTPLSSPFICPGDCAECPDAEALKCHEQ